MVLLKCKVCGGTLKPQADGTGLCDSCGCVSTLPLIDDDKRSQMYNRGNEARRKGRFERAYTAYQHIIADDPEDAEAHWCLMLCRYGIQYIQETGFGQFEMVCRRMQPKPVTEDPDYQAAIKNASPAMAELYRREAAEIEKIQKRYFEVSRQAENYEVYLCCNTEADGSPVQACEVADRLYQLLTGKNVSVFYLPVSLSGKETEEQEAYIYSAIQTAKIMLVIATGEDQLNAPFVRNQWGQFLAMMDKDSTRSMIPVFRDISPYDIPEEIPGYMGQDLGHQGAANVGAEENLLQQVLKLLGRGDEATLARRKASLRAQLRDAEKALADGRFEKAKESAALAIKSQADNPDAYYILFLANQKVRHGWEMADKDPAWTKDQNYLRAVRQKRNALSDEVKKGLDELQEIAGQEALYQEACALQRDGKHEKALALFGEAGTYRDAPLKAEASRKALKRQAAQEEFRKEYKEAEKQYLNSEVSKKAEALRYPPYPTIMMPKAFRQSVRMNWLALAGGLVCFVLAHVLPESIMGDFSMLSMVFMIPSMGAAYGICAMATSWLWEKTSVVKNIVIAVVIGLLYPMGVSANLIFGLVMLGLVCVHLCYLYSVQKKLSANERQPKIYQEYVQNQLLPYRKEAQEKVIARYEEPLGKALVREEANKIAWQKNWESNI